MGVFRPDSKLSLSKNYKLLGIVQGLSQVQSGMREVDVKQALQAKDREGSHRHVELADDLLTYTDERRLHEDELLLASRGQRADAPFLVWAALLLADERLRSAVCHFLVASDGTLVPAHCESKKLGDWYEANAVGGSSARKAATNTLGLFDQLGIIEDKSRYLKLVVSDPASRDFTVVPLLTYLEQRMQHAGESSKKEKVIQLAAELGMHQWLAIPPEEFSKGIAIYLDKDEPAAAKAFSKALAGPSKLLKKKVGATVVHAPLGDREDELRGRVEQLSEQYHLRQEQAFSMWYCERRFRLEPKAARSCSFDKSSDRGLDFFYKDDLRRQVHLGQIAYAERRTNTPIKEKLTHTLDHLEQELDDPARLRAERLFELADVADRYTAAVADGYEILLHFVFTARSSPDLRRIADDFTQEQEIKGTDRALVFADMDELLDLMVVSEAGVSQWAPPTTLALDAGKYFVESQANGQRTLMTSLPGTVFKAWVQEHENVLFGQNVRFLQKRSGVNAQIAETLADPGERGNFWSYNNGITILTKGFDVDPVTHELRLQDFSIVNGCQTASSIHQASSQAASEIRVATRIVSLGGMPDEDFATNVIRFTNSQNAVKATALASKDALQQEIAKHVMKWSSPWFYELRDGDFTGMSKQNCAVYERGSTGKTRHYRLIIAPEGGQRLAAFRGYVKTAYSDKTGVYTTQRSSVFPDALAVEEHARLLVWAWECGEAAQQAAKEMKTSFEAKQAGKDSKYAEIIRKRALVEKLIIAVMKEYMVLDHGEELFEKTTSLQTLGTHAMREQLDWYAHKAAATALDELVEYLNRNKKDVLIGIRQDRTFDEVLVRLRKDFKVYRHQHPHQMPSL